MSDPAPSFTDLVHENPAESAREDQCPARHKGRCLALNVELGWDHGLPLSECDECWARGGLEGGPDAERWRRERAAALVRHFKRPELRAKLGRPVLVALTVKHTEPDERRALLADDNVRFGLRRNAEWSKVRPTWSKASSLLKSLGSRLLEGAVDRDTKNRRHISCFGTTLEGERLAEPCPSLATCADGVHHYCNACECGEWFLSILDQAEDEQGRYTKLDFPYLECPRQRDGFSNARPSPTTPLTISAAPSAAAERAEPGAVVFECDGPGAGDLTMAAWFAHGYRAVGRPAHLWATRPDRQDLIRLWGLEPTPPGPGSLVFPASVAYDDEVHVNKGAIPRVRYLRTRLPDTPEPVRPPSRVPEKDWEWACLEHDGHRPMVLLFPAADWGCRQWPRAYWVDLAWIIERAGARAVACLPSDLESWKEQFPFAYWGQPWPRVAALMRRASLVVANDSGPSHIAGTLGVPTLALMGPTRGVFAHIPEVREVSVSRWSMRCVGCYFQGDRGYRAACDVGCGALMRLWPSDVARHVARALRGAA